MLDVLLGEYVTELHQLALNYFATDNVSQKLF